MVSKMKSGQRPRRVKSGPNSYRSYNSRGEQTSVSHKNASGVTVTEKRDGTKIQTWSGPGNTVRQIIDRPDRKRGRKRKDELTSKEMIYGVIFLVVVAGIIGVLDRLGIRLPILDYWPHWK